MKLLRVLFFLLVPFFFVTLAYAQSFPKPVGYVNDFAKLYSDSYRSELEGSLRQFEASTSAEIVVATVTNLDGTTVDDYAVRLFENWKIGKDKKDNGVLLLTSKEEREVRIEVGYGLESVITDARAGRIIRDQIVPAFKTGDYEGGTTEAVSTLMKYVRGETVVEPEAKPQADWTQFFDFIPFLFFGVIYLGSFLARTKEFYAGGIIGILIGVIISLIISSFIWFVLLPLILGLVGLFLDFVLSRNYQRLKDQNKPTDWWGSRGGFYGGGGFGGGGGGGFGGFGGGSSGGGGASGRW